MNHATVPPQQTDEERSFALNGLWLVLAFVPAALFLILALEWKHAVTTWAGPVFLILNAVCGLVSAYNLVSGIQRVVTSRPLRTVIGIVLWLTFQAVNLILEFFTACCSQ